MRRILLISLLLLAVPRTSAGDDVPVPVFSQPHGLYEQPFTLKLSCADPSAVIVFTTDGSTPCITSPRYTVPLPLNENTVLRAMAVAGDSCSKVVTSTYLFTQHILAQADHPDGFPDTWGPFTTSSDTTMADYGMDPELTSNPQTAVQIVEGLHQLPIISLVTERQNFFGKETDPQNGGIYVYTGATAGDGLGRGWERPVSFEMFGGPQHFDVQSDCGIRLHGGQSRIPEKSPKHSLRLVWRDVYGKDKLNTPLYGLQTPEEFHTLILHSAYNNSWLHWEKQQRHAAQYTRDLWAKSTQQRMGHTAASGFGGHLFINGLYWGLYNVSERIDKDFCASHYGGDNMDWDVVKVEELEKENILVAAEGNLKKWEEMIATARCAAKSDSAYYRLQGLDENGVRNPMLEPLLDVDNFIDYMILNQYAGNTDWDVHNWYAVRRRVNPDAGFQFLCWDSEMIFGNKRENVLKPKGYRKGALTELFATLMDNPLFAIRFQERVSMHCTGNGILTPDSVTAVWNTLYSGIDNALYAESARWGDYRCDVHPGKGKGDLYTPDDSFVKERRRLLEDYFPARTAIYLRQLKRRGWYP